MDRFKSILVAGSPGHLEPLTLRAAVELADVNQAELTVMDVVARIPRRHRRVEVEGRVVDVEAALVGEREQQLRRMVENARGGSEVKVMAAVGEPFIEVIQRVLEFGHDLVMLGEPGPETGNTCQLSSGVMHVLRKCPVPVWVMRPSQARKLQVLALVDPDPEDPIRDGLNDLAMDLATSLCSRKDGELHVGHAWSLDGEATLRTSPYVQMPGAIVDVMVREAEAAHSEQLSALVARHHVDEMRATIHMVSGEPRRELPLLAERLDIGLIVMGTVARAGLSGLIMGNTAETILQSVRCSVLAVKPEGFVTPVKPRRDAR